jgi:hypothetical protein
MEAMEGGDVKRSASAIALVPVLLLAGGGCSSEQSSDWKGAVKTSTPVKTFAPLLNIHPRERWLPMSAGAFIASSTLRWAGGDCRSAYAVVARSSEPSRLAGHPPYRHAARRQPGCHKAKVFATTDYTRPHDTLRDNTIAQDEGFFLDLDDRARVGTPPVSADGGTPETDVPVYYDRVTDRKGDHTTVRITYFTLYAQQRKPGPALARAGSHEGDWKWIRVLLRGRPGTDEYLPVAVRYGVRSQYLPWRSVVKARSADGAQTHPSIFVSLGGHTSYPKPGRYARPAYLDDRKTTYFEESRACPACIEWRSWRHLRRARTQPWYGYGGGWGESLGFGESMAGLAPTPWGEGTKEALLPAGKIE